MICAYALFRETVCTCSRSMYISFGLSSVANWQLSVCIYNIMLMQCDDTCPRLGGWNSMITIGARRARSIYVTWTADAQSSLYVVQYRLRNTQVYTSSLEVRNSVASHVRQECMSHLKSVEGA